MERLKTYFSPCILHQVEHWELHEDLDDLGGHAGLFHDGRTYDSIEEFLACNENALSSPVGPADLEREQAPPSPASSMSSVSDSQSRPASPDNGSLADLEYYVGTMDSVEAENLLERRPVGTFLLRRRPRDLALRISYRSLSGRGVAHIVVAEEEESDGPTYSVLDVFAATVPDLVLLLKTDPRAKFKFDVPLPDGRSFRV